MSFQHAIQRIMSGEARGLGPSLARGGLALVEPLYRLAINRRNCRYDRSTSTIRKLPRPVISVGNLTTGGTGKTPLIRWLAGTMRDRGLNVAILSRGYKATPGSPGDEQRMLLAQLQANAATATTQSVQIECDPDRFVAGQRVLERAPNVDLFLLDDGFQHRRLHRDLDIVLLHCAEPFGYRHLLPRGLLREPVSSLLRAGGIVVTNVPLDWDASKRQQLVGEIRRWNDSSPIVFERHEPVGFRSATAASADPPDHPITDLASRRVFSFSGLGSPAGFEKSVARFAATIVGTRRFPDHYQYMAGDLMRLQEDAKAAGADVLVTSEKDWVKLATLPAAMTANPPIWRLDIAAQFLDSGPQELLSLVERTLK